MFDGKVIENALKTQENLLKAAQQSNDIEARQVAANVPGFGSIDHLYQPFAVLLRNQFQFFRIHSLFMCWEPFPQSSSLTDWEIRPGARVKLENNTRIETLTIADADDVKIDLAGHTLTVWTLFVDGEKKKGKFTAATLPSVLTGEGTLVVTGPGSIYVVR